MTKDAGHQTMWLGVWERNARARSFYRRQGFVAVGDHVFMLGEDAQTDIIIIMEHGARRPAPNGIYNQRALGLVANEAPMRVFIGFMTDTDTGDCVTYIFLFGVHFEQINRDGDQSSIDVVVCGAFSPRARLEKSSRRTSGVMERCWCFLKSSLNCSFCSRLMSCL